ncbi:MAG: sigma-70 family RNA polymerase sigma factor [Bacteroides sp.]|uniref:sigma-70 family RNA polymerase sigma factor n=1 Tax=Bacteroides sp. TaxID=29523 RepID=UPI002FCB4016|nr:sigma-70 family RNA polymerase sigma factor [Bacteroides sp.]
MQQPNTFLSAIELEQWIDEHSKTLLDRASYLLSNKEDAKDVVQEVFFAAYKSGASFQRKSSVLTWLTGILYHKVSDVYNKRHGANACSISFDEFFDRHGEWGEEEVVETWEQEEHSPGRLLDNPDFHRVFAACMERLPERWMLAIKKCYLQEQKAAEICEELNLSSTNYWKVLQRSRLQLRKCIDINWFKK